MEGSRGFVESTNVLEGLLEAADSVRLGLGSELNEEAVEFSGALAPAGDSITPLR